MNSPPDPRRRGFRTRHDVEEVDALLAERIRPLPGGSISILESVGRVLTVAVTSPCDVPAFDRAAMDGYAVIAKDTFGATEYAPITLTEVGCAMPGRAFDGTVGREQCVRIMTGAPLPAGADAVLPFEQSRAHDTEVQAVAAITPDKHVGRRGEDVRTDDRLLEPGRVLRPQDVGVLASVGVDLVTVRRHPAVTILATGDELVPALEKPSEHKIVDSNTPMLAALVDRDGGTAHTPDIIADDRTAIRDAIAAAANETDVVLVTGGSSVGEEDHAPDVVRELGELVVHGVAMRPSSPTGVGFIDDCPVFLLPGNPVSALCAYEFFAGPSIRALGGRPRAWPHHRRSLPLAKKITSTSGRVDYCRVRIVDDRVEPLMVSGASILSSTTRADGVVIVPRDDEGIPAETTVEVFLYDGHSA